MVLKINCYFVLRAAVLCVVFVHSAQGHPHGTCNGCNDNSGTSSGESSSGKEKGDCFPGDAKVITKTGEITIIDLLEQEDTEIQVIDPGSGQLIFTPVRLWLHVSHASAKYLKIETAAGDELDISKTHFIYKTPCPGDRKFQKLIMEGPIFAEKLHVGDCVLVLRNDLLFPDQITNITEVTKQGRYQFTTSTGTVIVNNMMASTYSIIDNNALQHYIFSGMYYLHKVLKVVLPQKLLLNDDSKNAFADTFFTIFHTKILF